MRMRAVTAAGLAPSLSLRPHQRCNSASLAREGANFAGCRPCPRPPRRSERRSRAPLRWETNRKTAKSCRTAPARGNGRDRSRQTIRTAAPPRKSRAAAACSMPAASITARKSSMRCSRPGSSPTRSDMPVAALVESDHPGIGPETTEKTREVGLLPIILDVRDKSGNQHEVDRTLAKTLGRRCERRRSGRILVTACIERFPIGSPGRDAQSGLNNRDDVRAPCNELSKAAARRRTLLQAGRSYIIRLARRECRPRIPSRPSTRTGPLTRKARPAMGF